VNAGSLAAIEYTFFHMPTEVAQSAQPAARWASTSPLIFDGPTPRTKSVQTSSEKCFTPVLNLGERF
jgi:hypothetical protein